MQNKRSIVMQGQRIRPVCFNISLLQALCQLLLSLQQITVEQILHLCYMHLALHALRCHLTYLILQAVELSAKQVTLPSTPYLLMAACVTHHAAMPFCLPGRLSMNMTEYCVVHIILLMGLHVMRMQGCCTLRIAQLCS